MFVGWKKGLRAVGKKAGWVRDEDLLYNLGLFDPEGTENLRAVRRPAGEDLVVEFVPKAAWSREGALAAFWLATLWRFLEDSHQNTLAFEGLAYQAVAERLDAKMFEGLFEQVRSRLTLPPPYGVELREAFRVLNGRVTSFVGTTTDGEMWASFFQAGVFQLDALAPLD